MKTGKTRLIVTTAICTTAFWAVVIGALIWFGGEPAAQVHFFARPGQLDIFKGVYQVEVISTNQAGHRVLLTHIAHAPERVSFSLQRLDEKRARGGVTP